MNRSSMLASIGFSGINANQGCDMRSDDRIRCSGDSLRHLRIKSCASQDNNSPCRLRFSAFSILKLGRSVSGIGDISQITNVYAITPILQTSPCSVKLPHLVSGGVPLRAFLTITFWHSATSTWWPKPKSVTTKSNLSSLVFIKPISSSDKHPCCNE